MDYLAEMKAHLFHFCHHIGFTVVCVSFVMMKRAAKALHVLSKHKRGWSHSDTVTVQRMFLPPNRLHFSVAEDDLNECVGTSDYGRWHNGGGYCHKSAAIDPTARIEIGALVHSESVLRANVHVGSGAVVGPSVSVGESTKIGWTWLGKRGDQLLYDKYNAVLSNCSVGVSCVIHSGVCIGQDGFGFLVDEEGCVKKKPQVLYVRIGNDVEIGANTCVDRGSWRDTVIGDHSKIDNLVQIGHNVIIGKCCILCGQVGIAGSVTIGDYVTMGGRVAVRDHVSIASKVRLAANTCVMKDILSPGDYGGFPAVPIHEWRRQVSKLQRFYRKDSNS